MPPVPYMSANAFVQDAVAKAAAQLARARHAQVAIPAGVSENWRKEMYYQLRKQYNYDFPHIKLIRPVTTAELRNGTTQKGMAVLYSIVANWKNGMSTTLFFPNGAWPMLDPLFQEMRPDPVKGITINQLQNILKGVRQGSLSVAKGCELYQALFPAQFDPTVLALHNDVLRLLYPPPPPPELEGPE